MASPHVAGVAALVRQRHPGFRPEQIKSLIVGTAVQAKVSPFNARLAGSGMVQPRRAVDSVAYRPGDGADAQPLVRLRPDPDRRLPRVEVVHDLQLECVADHLQARRWAHQPARLEQSRASPDAQRHDGHRARPQQPDHHRDREPHGLAARREQVRQPDRARRHRLGQPAQLRRRDHGHSDRVRVGPLSAARPVARRAAVRVERRRVRAIGVHRVGRRG